MRDFLKFLIVGIVLFCSRQAYAGDYNVLVIPDNIVTEDMSVDSYIYNDAAEFFANEVVTLLNTTDNIFAPAISNTRALYKKDPSTYLLAKKMTGRFKTTYNFDSIAVKKLADKSKSRYVLLITSYLDYENYVLRRTFWDFLNVPGATVIDPAYKVSTYAVLFDTKTNSKLWSDTYYKTISVCENRIITRGPSPQVEQLEKIRDYSRNLCPKIVQNVQLQILPPEVYATETIKIVDDMANLDNVFTKKYRQYIKSCKKKMEKKETEQTDDDAATTEKLQNQFQTEPQTKLEVKAQPVKEINNETIKKDVEKLYSNQNNSESPINYYKEPTFDIKKSKTNPLINNTKKNPPSLRDYSL